MAGQELTDEKIKELVEECLKAKQQSYSPYSMYKVGAALLTTEGKIFTGCNVENSAYPLSTCAERTAVVKAVSEGYKNFSAIAVATDTSDNYASPCGACRQIISEFGMDTTVILAKPDGTYIKKTIRELLPHGFSAKDLRGGQNAA